MEIRRPNEEEIKQIISLTPQAIREGTLGEAKPSMEKTKQMVEDLLRKDGYYLISTKDNQLTGWILVGGSKDKLSDKPIGFIYELFVLKEHRGKSISKHLLKAAIDHLKQDGYSEIRLSVYNGNFAMKLYESFGFKNKVMTMSLSIYP